MPQRIPEGSATALLVLGGLALGAFALSKFLPSPPPPPSANACIHGEYVNRGFGGDCPIGYHDCGLFGIDAGCRPHLPFQTPECRCDCWDKPDHRCP